MDSDGSQYQECVALSDADCRNSEICLQQGYCKAMDGTCENPDAPAVKKRREETIANIRRLSLGLTRECEATKARFIGVLREDGYPNPSAAWAKLVGLDQEIAEEVKDFRHKTGQQYLVVEMMLDHAKDLLGNGCATALRSGISIGQSNCLYRGNRQDLEWLQSIGIEECRSH